MSVTAAGSLEPERRAGLGAAYWRLWTATAASSAGDGLLSVALPRGAATRTRPAAGGIVFAVMPAAPFIADAASFVSSALLLRRLGPLFSVPTRRASASLRRDMSEGVAFLRRSTTLRRLATLTSCYAGCQAMVG